MNKKHLAVLTTVLFFLLMVSSKWVRAENGPIIVKKDPLACPVTSLITQEDFTFKVDHDTDKLKDVFDNKDKA